MDRLENQVKDIAFLILGMMVIPEKMIVMMIICLIVSLEYLTKYFHLRRLILKDSDCNVKKKSVFKKQVSGNKAALNNITLLLGNRNGSLCGKRLTLVMVVCLASPAASSSIT